ncbi:hypothetical protein EHW97_08095 [Aeromicrobium camelliae]|uniref:Uncharacterized protein n=1 Tax=Aeromicrobium camelliae TaxID=1538144 RepID=A0A3N6WKZ9_9ACTN|nr:hypothetical protein [Aeromicrobium camelliae]RQN07980.1 hypothetical protein EHW97_08095 [Aeromicrobium camelliae]
MDPRTFALAYPRDPVSPRSYGPRIDKLLVDSRSFSHGFGRILHDALTGRPLPQRFQFRTWATRYTSWLNRGMGGLEREFDALLEGLSSSQDFTRLFMELNFHRLNAPVASWWETLLYDGGTASLSGSQVTRARFELSKTALTVVRSRDQLVERDLYFTDDFEEFRGWMIGALTEMDGMVALMELCRRIPGTFVIPAPPQFENMAGPANADLIVVQPRDGWRVRGVQLKASSTHRHVDRYDRDRVTLVDGIVDMYNERAMRRHQRRSDKDVVSWPGLVAAHYLASLAPGRETEEWSKLPDLYSTSSKAQEATHSTVSRNQEVFDTLIERIVADLGPAAVNGEGEGPGIVPTH